MAQKELEYHIDNFVEKQDDKELIERILGKAEKDQLEAPKKEEIDDLFNEKAKNNEVELDFEIISRENSQEIEQDGNIEEAKKYDANELETETRILSKDEFCEAAIERLEEEIDDFFKGQENQKVLQDNNIDFESEFGEEYYQELFNFHQKIEILNEEQKKQQDI